MWEAMAERIEDLGARSLPARRSSGSTSRTEGRGGRGRQRDDPVRRRDLLLPLRALAEIVQPAPPPEALAAARGLAYRDFLTVALVLPGDDLFPDNWVYVHDPSVRVGRIQNFRSWSPWMVPEADRTCVGLEYFCFEGDDLWDSGDDRLVELPPPS